MNIELLLKRALVGAAGGALTAGHVDYQAFRTWKDWHDVSSYNWRTASWRWVQGAIIGAVATAGVGAVLG